MSRGPVVIEVTRGPVVESRHEGIAAVVKADGTVVESWGDIEAAIALALSADEVAAAAGTISYELFCALARRVPVTVS